MAYGAVAWSSLCCYHSYAEAFSAHVAIWCQEVHITPTEGIESLCVWHRFGNFCCRGHNALLYLWKFHDEPPANSWTQCPECYKWFHDSCGPGDTAVCYFCLG